MRFLGMLALALAGGANAEVDPLPMTLSQQERDWIAAHPVLRVGVFDDLQPFEYMRGGELRGLSAKYLQLIARRTGLQFEPVNTTTRSARKDMLLSGEVDVLSTRRRSVDPLADRGMLYTQPYNTSSTILVSRFSDHPFVDLEHLTGKRLVMLGREGYAPFLNSQISDVTVISAKNAEDMLAMVSRGGADAAIASEWLVIPYLSRQYKGVLQISGVVPSLHRGVSMAVRDTDVILFSILEKVLASINTDERKRIYEEWLAGLDVDIPTIQAITEHYESELWLLLTITLLLLMLVWQSRVLRIRATQGERDKAMFLAVMSHEVRSPLNAVLAAMELLQQTPLDEHQRNLANLAISGAHTLLRLVDDVLDISKMEAGKLQLDPEPTDLLALTEAVVEGYRESAEEKGLDLTLTGDRQLPCLMLDHRRVAQVVRHLIANAIKYTECGSVQVQLHRLGGTGEVEQVSVRVIDTGVGLSRQAQRSLFRPSWRFKHSSRRMGGTRLGLVLCRRLVSLMQGQLVLASKLGKGTRIDMILPLVLAPRVDTVRNSEQMQALAMNIVPPRGVRVLLVKKPTLQRQALVELLLRLGCETLVADDAEQGLSLFRENAFRLALLDWDSLDGGAVRLAEAFREWQHQRQRPYLPLIALGGATGHDGQEHCFDAGVDGLLIKPVQSNQLEQIIALWCNVPLTPELPTHAETFESTLLNSELRTHINNLVEALAMHDNSRASQVLHQWRLAQSEDFARLTLALEAIDRLLKGSTDWPAEALALPLRMLLMQWTELCHAAQAPGNMPAP
ncbi:transporter substrate-binding domain-containing protein [Pseudomonas sp. MG-9]|uniref:ATP-binding protein n=1 Tax=Pseudomonas sp. MG-9 TaxID=2839032 RepID=UPI001BFFFF0F|nr:transporter substrate-binding domain-containing protein [Pseudomonas sp. MG-9]MBT9266234.1 transporter substrate-binding domain-containing protein [Pseudomonas sp. MG-9]